MTQAAVGVTGGGLTCHRVRPSLPPLLHFTLRAGAPMSITLNFELNDHDLAHFQAAAGGISSLFRIPRTLKPPQAGRSDDNSAATVPEQNIMILQVFGVS